MNTNLNSQLKHVAFNYDCHLGYDYDPLYAELSRMRAQHVRQSYWVFLNTTDAQAIGRRLQPFFGPRDSFELRICSDPVYEHPASARYVPQTPHGTILGEAALAFADPDRGGSVFGGALGGGAQPANPLKRGLLANSLNALDSSAWPTKR
ncbi:hypothetical protein [Qipengyuania sp.]|uniref:hypothetical protein n=1 Tax=Qipengyuania sp. TaxID=2004515 RepID=UPI0035C7DAD2